jgi:hypothetical protein
MVNRKSKQGKSPPRKKPARKPATFWDANRDAYLIELLLAAKEKGGMSENSFTPTVFTETARMIEEKYPSEPGASSKDLQSVKAHWHKVLFSLFICFIMY